MMNVMDIGTRRVGGDAPALIVAEIGANHNGSPETAAELVRAAAACGVDAVKFQTYTSDDLVADKGRLVCYGPPGKERCEPVGAMFDRVALPRAAYPELFALADELGLIAFSTPFSVAGIAFLESLGVPAIKIASSDVCYTELLQSAASTGLPVLLATGKSTLAEVDTALDILVAAGCRNVGLLHCVAQYPAPAEEMNLHMVKAYASMYPDVVVGLSDHSRDEVISLAAVALGAKIIEKHFTLDRNAPGPDHWFSEDSAGMARIVDGARLLEGALRPQRKRVMPCEAVEKEVSCRSLVAAQPLKAGTMVEEKHLKALRPGHGIHPYDLPKILGLVLTRDVPANEPVLWEHFKP